MFSSDLDSKLEFSDLDSKLEQQPGAVIIPMVDWFTAFNMMPSWLVQVNCLEIQILSEIVFSFSLPINVVIYNGRVAHLEGNLLPLT